MDAAEPRKSDRRHVLLNATIISSDGRQAARIRDLSPSGANVLCDRPPALDCDVIFQRGRLFAAARVAWSREGAAGLEFYRKLEPGELTGR